MSEENTKITEEQIAQALKDKLVKKGKSEEERKKKAEWFDKHVIVTKA